MSETVPTIFNSFGGTQHLPVNDCAQVFTYSGSNVVAITLNYQGFNYQQTFTYSGSNVINISQWTPIA